MRVEKALREEQPYDFLFIDWKMPDLDGEMTIRELYGKFPRESLPYLVMISAYGESECQRISKEMKLDGFLSKPMGQSDLYNLIRDILSKARRRDEHEIALPGGGEHTFGVKDACVLVVEDNEINQEIAEELLLQLGVRVKLVGNGAEAIEAVKSQPFDLIFMDVQMPVMDGLVATQRIRALETCGKEELPIIAMTAHAMKGDYEKSIEAGMNDHITKPIDPQVLARTVVKWVSSAQQRRSSRNIMPSRESEGAPPLPKVAESAGDQSAGPSLFSSPIPGIFPEEGLGYTAGNEQLYLTLLKKLPARFKEIPRLLETALAASDGAEVLRHVQNVKTMCTNLGIRNVAEAAKALENELINGGDVSMKAEIFSLELSETLQLLEGEF
jgi:two-component system sensor histidine kinase/response regulator